MDLPKLIDQARKESKWLFCFYQNLWFSPDQLEAENAAGRFRWSAENWQLREPRDRLEQARAATAAAQAEERRIADLIARR